MGEDTRRDAAPSTRSGTTTGAGRLLVAVYALFAVAATSRATYQILTKFNEAPTAYVLSAVAAAVYLVATIALAQTGATARRVALTAVVTELVGVLVIGTITATSAVDFPHDTVWSVYGRGYLFIPLFLPVIGLFYLRRTGPVSRE